MINSLEREDSCLAGANPGEVRTDVYSRVTHKIIADLENGVRTWLKPWSVTHTAGKITRPLRTLASLIRASMSCCSGPEAVSNGYATPIWMAYKQATALNAHVRKGEHGTMVVYADRYTKAETDETEPTSTLRFMRAYTVFNVDQIEGLPQHYYATVDSPLPLTARIAKAEGLIASTNAEIRHGGNMALYARGPDRIQLPPFERFKDAESYYATALRELTHWTKHETRLARDFGRKRFGDEGYAREELVAELGAAFLCADIGITPEPRADHAEYLQHWLTVLKADKRAIFSAAAYAQRAAHYVTAFQAKRTDVASAIAA